MKKTLLFLTVVCTQTVEPKAKLYSEQHSESVEKHRFNKVTFEHRIRSDNGVKYEEFFVNGKLTDQVTYDHEITKAREEYKKSRDLDVKRSPAVIDNVNQDLAISVASKQVERTLKSIQNTLNIVGQDFLKPYLMFSHGAIHDKTRLDNVKKSYELWKKHHKDYVAHKNVDGLNRLWQHLQSIDRELSVMYDATVHEIVTKSTDNDLIQKLHTMIG